MRAIPRHRRARVVRMRIIGCPECQRRFTTYKNLNLHLTQRHDVPYLCVPPKTLTETTGLKPRPKRRP